MHQRLVFVALAVVAVLALVAGLVFVFKDKLIQTIPLNIDKTQEDSITSLENIPDLPPPAGVENRSNSSSDSMNLAPTAEECAGATGEDLQSCCYNWEFSNKLVHAQCEGSWQFTNNSCVFACGTSAAPSSDPGGIPRPLNVPQMVQ